MSYDQEPISPMFRIDVSADAKEAAPSEAQGTRDGMAYDLLRQLVIGQQQQNKILEQLCQQNAAMQQQRTNELQQWKSANPQLARSCRQAAETLSRVQTQFLDNLTEEIAFQEENLLDGEFSMNEFVDRYGPRLAHLNGVLQVLAQLGTSDPSPQ